MAAAQTGQTHKRIALLKVLMPRLCKDEEEIGKLWETWNSCKLECCPYPFVVWHVVMRCENLERRERTILKLVWNRSELIAAVVWSPSVTVTWQEWQRQGVCSLWVGKKVRALGVLVIGNQWKIAFLSTANGDVEALGKLSALLEQILFHFQVSKPCFWTAAMFPSSL